MRYSRWETINGRQEVGDRSGETEGGRQEVGDRRRETGGERQEAGDREFKAYFFRSLSQSRSKMDQLRNTDDVPYPKNLALIVQQLNLAKR